MLGKRVIIFERLKIRSNFIYVQIRLVFTDSVTYTLCKMSEHFIKKQCNADTQLLAYQSVMPCNNILFLYVTTSGYLVFYIEA